MIITIIITILKQILSQQASGTQVTYQIKILISGTYMDSLLQYLLHECMAQAMLTWTIHCSHFDKQTSKSQLQFVGGTWCVRLACLICSRQHEVQLKIRQGVVPVPSSSSSSSKAPAAASLRAASNRAWKTAPTASWALPDTTPPEPCLHP